MARCLGWGATAAFSHRSLSSTLHDVEHATIALLDRCPNPPHKLLPTTA